MRIFTCPYATAWLSELNLVWPHAMLIASIIRFRRSMLVCKAEMSDAMTALSEDGNEVRRVLSASSCFLMAASCETTSNSRGVCLVWIEVMRHFIARMWPIG